MNQKHDNHCNTTPSHFLRTKPNEIFQKKVRWTQREAVSLILYFNFQNLGQEGKLLWIVATFAKFMKRWVITFCYIVLLWDGFGKLFLLLWLVLGWCPGGWLFLLLFGLVVMFLEGFVRSGMQLLFVCFGPFGNKVQKKFWGWGKGDSQVGFDMFSFFFW